MPAYRDRVKERFGIGIPHVGNIDVWVHAVSLGEVIAATPLLEAMLKKQWKIMVTTMTPTGSAQVMKRFGHGLLHSYVPYDLPFVVKKYLKRMNPKVIVIMETEIWPNLIYFSKKRNIPIYLANARLSAVSLKGYLKAKRFFQSVLKNFTAIFVQSLEDASRFVQLGAPEEHIQVLGNMKFDVQDHQMNKDEWFAFKTSWGEERPVLMLASTHEKEEALILAKLSWLKKNHPSLMVILAPRHPERFDDVFDLSKEYGFKTAKRSDLNSISRETDVLILDSIGELLGWYGLSNVAFVGGSLVAVGGHNVLEPIVQGIPVITGPHMFHFQSISEDLLRNEAMVQIQDVEGLIKAVERFFEDKEYTQSIVSRAQQVLEANTGAVTKHLQFLQEGLELSKQSGP